MNVACKLLCKCLHSGYSFFFVCPYVVNQWTWIIKRSRSNGLMTSCGLCVLILSRWLIGSQPAFLQCVSDPWNVIVLGGEFTFEFIYVWRDKPGFLFSFFFHIIFDVFFFIYFLSAQIFIFIYSTLEAGSSGGYFKRGSSPRGFTGRMSFLTITQPPPLNTHTYKHTAQHKHIYTHACVIYIQIGDPFVLFHCSNLHNLNNTR